MTTAEKFDSVIARIAILEAKSEKIDHIEALLLKLTAQLPLPPQPPKPAATPKWAPQGPHGQDYAGEPSAPTGGSDLWGGYSREKNTLPDGSWRDPTGMWRDARGEAIARPGAYTPKPVGPDRDPQHDYAVRLLDTQFDRMIPEKEEEPT